MITTDRNLPYQQNLKGRKIAIVVLGKGRWSLMKPHVTQIVAAVNAATPGSFNRGGNPLRVGPATPRKTPQTLWWFVVPLVLFSAVAESVLASRYLGTQREES